MNDSHNRRLDSFIRSRDHFAQVADQFAANGVAQQTATQFAAVITQIEAKAAAQAGNIGLARQHTVNRQEARRELRLDLEAINRAARIMGLQNEFALPPEDNDRLLLNAARAFAANALPLKAQFIAHEMPADFLEDLAADITAFEEAIADQSDAVGGHVAAGAALEDLFDEGTEHQKKLDGFMRNKFANNAERLAEWTRASHVERAPRHKKTAGGAPPSAPSAPTPSA
jgi:hypothetical protein